MEKVKKIRNTNIEYVRLLAIFLVIINHYALLGGFEFDNPLSLNALTVQFLHSGGKFGVNLFIFISGYYSSTSKRVNFRHISKFVLEVIFYSIIFAFIGYYFHTLSMKGIIKTLAAIPFGQWPFITCYFMLMCLSFWTNKLIYALTEKQHLALLVFLGFTWCLVPTFLKAEFAMSTFTWYMYVYLVAGYVRRVIDKINYSPKTMFLICAGSFGVIWLSELVLTWVGVHYFRFALSKAEHFRHINSLFILIATVSLVIGVLKLEPKHNPFIQVIASTTLGIFMIHDNKAMIPLIWTGIFRTDQFAGSRFLILHALGTCILIMAVCVILDLIRQQTVGRLEDKLFGKEIDDLDRKINAFLGVK